MLGREKQTDEAVTITPTGTLMVAVLVSHPPGFSSLSKYLVLAIYLFIFIFFHKVLYFIYFFSVCCYWDTAICLLCYNITFIHSFIKILVTLLRTTKPHQKNVSHFSFWILGEIKILFSKTFESN